MWVLKTEDWRYTSSVTCRRSGAARSLRIFGSVHEAVPGQGHGAEPVSAEREHHGRLGQLGPGSMELRAWMYEKHSC